MSMVRIVCGSLGAPMLRTDHSFALDPQILQKVCLPPKTYYWCGDPLPVWELPSYCNLQIDKYLLAAMAHSRTFTFTT